MSRTRSALVALAALCALFAGPLPAAAQYDLPQSDPTDSFSRNKLNATRWFGEEFGFHPLENERKIVNGQLVLEHLEPRCDYRRGAPDNVFAANSVGSLHPGLITDLSFKVEVNRMNMTDCENRSFACDRVASRCSTVF